MLLCLGLSSETEETEETKEREMTILGNNLGGYKTSFIIRAVMTQRDRGVNIVTMFYNKAQKLYISSKTIFKMLIC